MKAVGVGLLPTVLCAALASAAQAQPGEIVFASNRSPELLVLHRYSIGVDGTGWHDLGSADGLLSPNVRFAARIVDDATTSRVDVVPVAGGAALTVASFSRTDASRRQEVVDVRWSPGGRRLAIVLFVGPANVYDLWVVGADGTGLRHVSLHARTPAWSPDGRELAFVGYVDRFGRDSILIADLASGRIRVRTPGLHPAWSPRGRLIAYVAPRGLGVLDAHEPGHRILRTLPGVGPPAWSPDGERVAFVGSGRTLTTVRPDGRGLRLLAHAPTPGSMTLFAWSPDSRRLAYVATTSTYLEPSSPAPTSTFPADYQILVVGVDGRGRRQVTHENPWASFTELRFAADGRRLLYAGEQTANDRELYTIEPDGSGLRQLTDNLVDDLDPAWSPDRRAIVFEQSNENGYNPPVDAGLFTLDLTGGAGTRLTTREFGQRDVHPAWSPDGGLIAFSRVTVAQPVGFDAELYEIRSDGSGLTQITSGTGSAGFPTWSPDGSHIAFSGRGSQIFVVARDGGPTRQLTQIGFASMPAWSPDGSRIAFFGEADLGGLPGLWVMNADGSDPHPIARTRFLNGPPSWSPDGSTLVYAEQTLDYRVNELHEVNADGSGDVVLTSSVGANEYPDWARR